MNNKIPIMMKYLKEYRYVIYCGVPMFILLFLNSHFQLKKLNEKTVGKIVSVYAITAGDYYEYTFTDFYGDKITGSSSELSHAIKENEFYVVLYEKGTSRNSHLLETYKLKDSMEINKYIDLGAQDFLTIRDKFRYTYRF